MDPTTVDPSSVDPTIVDPTTAIFGLCTCKWENFVLVGNPLHTGILISIIVQTIYISPLLNRPQGCQRCQKNQKDLSITTMIHFCASFQPKLNELHKKLQNQQKSSKYAGFGVIFQFFSTLAEN